MVPDSLEFQGAQDLMQTVLSLSASSLHIGFVGLSHTVQRSPTTICLIVFVYVLPVFSRFVEYAKSTVKRLYFFENLCEI